MRTFFHPAKAYRLACYALVVVNFLTLCSAAIFKDAGDLGGGVKNVHPVSEGLPSSGAKGGAVVDKHPTGSSGSLEALSGDKPTSGVLKQPTTLLAPVDRRPATVSLKIETMKTYILKLLAKFKDLQREIRAIFSFRVKVDIQAASKSPHFQELVKLEGLELVGLKRMNIDTMRNWLARLKKEMEREEPSVKNLNKQVVVQRGLYDLRSVLFVRAAELETMMSEEWKMYREVALFHKGLIQKLPNPRKPSWSGSKLEPAIEFDQAAKEFPWFSDITSTPGREERNLHWNTVEDVAKFEKWLSNTQVKSLYEELKTIGSQSNQVGKAVISQTAQSKDRVEKIIVSLGEMAKKLNLETTITDKSAALSVLAVLAAPRLECTQKVAAFSEEWGKPATEVLSKLTHDLTPVKSPTSPFETATLLWESQKMLVDALLERRLRF